MANEFMWTLLGLSLWGLVAAIMLWASVEKERNDHSEEGTKGRNSM